MGTVWRDTKYLDPIGVRTPNRQAPSESRNGKSGRTALLSHNLELDEVSGQLHATGAVPQAKAAAVHIKWEAGWAPQLVWSFWRRQMFLVLAGNRAAIPPTSSLWRIHDNDYALPVQFYQKVIFQNIKIQYSTDCTRTNDNSRALDLHLTTAVLPPVPIIPGARSQTGSANTSSC